MIWVYDLQDKIFTIIEAKCKKLLKAKYLAPTAYWTTESKTLNTPVFPTVYIHMLPPSEQAETLEKKTINAVNVTMQVDITTNKSEDIPIIASAITGAFKSIGFTISAFPDMEISNNIVKGTLRARRMIGSNDII